MKCAIHLGTAMVAVKTLAPRFVVAGEGTDSDGMPKRRPRTIFKCPVSGCWRVGPADDDGIEWRRRCRVCRKNLVDDGVRAAHGDNRCSECVAAQRRGAA